MTSRSNCHTSAQRIVQLPLRLRRAVGAGASQGLPIPVGPPQYLEPTTISSPPPPRFRDQGQIRDLGAEACEHPLIQLLLITLSGVLILERAATRLFPRQYLTFQWSSPHITRGVDLNSHRDFSRCRHIQHLGYFKTPMTKEPIQRISTGHQDRSGAQEIVHRQLNCDQTWSIMPRHMSRWIHCGRLLLQASLAPVFLWRTSTVIPLHPSWCILPQNGGSCSRLLSSVFLKGSKNSSLTLCPASFTFISSSVSQISTSLA